MLLIDGVRYQEWEISVEDDLEQMVIEHADEIFGGNSIYFDKKLKIKSIAGVGSIPDGLVIVLSDPPEWHIVEVELSSHDPYAHIVPQVDRFLVAVDNPETRNKIVGALYSVVDSDGLLKERIKHAVGYGKDVYKFLSDLIAKPPTVTILIEKDTDYLEEALRKYYPKKIIEFRTFRRVGAELVHAHLFEQLYKPISAIAAIISERPTGSEDSIEVTVSWRTYKTWLALFLPEDKRPFFPADKVRFELETDKSLIETSVAGTYSRTGPYIQRNMKDFFDVHPELSLDDTVRITILEPMKKYRLEIVK